MTNSVNIYYTDPLVKKNVDLMFKNNQDCGDSSYKTAVNCQLIRRLNQLPTHQGVEFESSN